MTRESVTVTVTVTNMDEPETLTLDKLQPKVDVQLTATLTDPDGRPGAALPITETDLTDSPTTWQWARSSSRNGPWTDIKARVASGDITAITSNTNIYTPGPDDVDSYLRATASYTDGAVSIEDDPDTEDVDESLIMASMTSDNPVLGVDYANAAPVFPDQDPDEDVVNTNQTRIIAENSAPGTAVGAPVAATDIGADDSQEVLTYTMTGTGASLFTINRQTGQITVGAGTTLDHEAEDTYTVTVTATDPLDEGTDITVTINVTDVDENPSIEENDRSRPYDEKATGDVVDYSAMDPEDNDADLMWSLSGADSSKFDISNTGVLTFESPPDFEARADSGRNNIYNVTVVVTDSGENTDSRDVTVTIRNIEETGAVVLVFDSVRPDTPMLQPEVGTRIRAKLTDDDGPSNVSWQWTRDGNIIGGATTPTYTPVADDVGQTLKAIATYDDGFDDGNTAEEESSDSTKADDATNKRPTFPDQSPLTIAENTPTTSDVPVGSAVEAEEDPTNEDDSTDDTLSYTLGGRDPGVFTIDNGTGQISVKAGTVLDHETKPTYTVTVTATDPSAASATVTVTINVTNVEENPSIAPGGETKDYPEIKNSRPNTDSVFTYSATDPEDDNAHPRLPLTWSLSGTDNGHFEISNRGVLTFISPRDHEDAADSGADNMYDVTVEVTDSDGVGVDDSRSVTVTVINVEEPGTVALTTLQPKEGEDLMAELDDPDGGVAADPTWQWARSSSRNGPWTDIEAREASNGITAITSDAATYTPGPDDVRMFLRAEVTYTDDATNPEG